MSVEEMMDFLVRNRSSALGPESVSALLDQMIWILRDNGAEIENVRTRWLEEADDLDRVRVALGMSETFPCNSREEIERACSRLIQKWPVLKARCDEILSNWDECRH